MLQEVDFSFVHFLSEKQLTAEWAWASATTCALQSLHKSTHREVRWPHGCVVEVLSDGILPWSLWFERALGRKTREEVFISPPCPAAETFAACGQYGFSEIVFQHTVQLRQEPCS